MRKWMRVANPLIISFVLLNLVLRLNKVKVPDEFKVNKHIEVLFPLSEMKKQERPVFLNSSTAPPFLGSSFIAFKEALAFKESTGNYFTRNSLGYLGKYQFGIETLQLVGIHNEIHFLNTPELQEKAFQVNIARNKWIMRKDIHRFVGKRVGSLTITESGMLAAAHLAGPGNVMKYLRSYGVNNKGDVYGTNISDYMRKFSGYDVSNIAPKRNPKV